jgi:hypothetical protein
MGWVVVVRWGSRDRNVVCPGRFSRSACWYWRPDRRTVCLFLTTADPAGTVTECAPPESGSPDLLARSCTARWRCSGISAAIAGT